MHMGPARPLFLPGSDVKKYRLLFLERACASLFPAVLSSLVRPHPGQAWAHELKHDRSRIHVRDGRVRLYTVNSADWSKRYPLIVESAARINGL
jgi:ATP-dependent DNA ligase